LLFKFPMGLGTDEDCWRGRPVNAFIHVDHADWISEAQHDHRIGPGRHWMRNDAQREPHLTLDVAPDELVETRRWR
jgi:hypothetical protein